MASGLNSNWEKARLMVFTQLGLKQKCSFFAFSRKRPKNSFPIFAKIYKNGENLGKIYFSKLLHINGYFSEIFVSAKIFAKKFVFPKVFEKICVRVQEQMRTET
jgi:hypothetical protein